MKRAFTRYLDAFVRASTIRDFRRQVVDFTHSLDFETVTAMLVIDQPFAPPEFHIVDNTPKAYLTAYYEPSFINLDPVMQHCKQSSQPLVWDQSTYIARNAGMLWEQQARYGYQTGAALALHFPRGKHFFLGVDRDRPISSDAKFRSDLISKIGQFAKIASASTTDLFLSETPHSQAVKLKSEELAVLAYSRDGLSVPEIADAMRKDEAVIAAHLVSSLGKLQCSTKYEAVIKAIRHGLL